MSHKAYRERMKKVMRQNEASHMADLHNDGRVGLHRTIAQAHRGYCQFIRKELMMKPSAHTRRLARRLAAGENVDNIIVDPCEGVAKCMRMVSTKQESDTPSQCSSYVIAKCAAPTPTAPPEPKKETRPLRRSHLPTAPPFAVLSEVVDPPSSLAYYRKRPTMSFFIPKEEKLIAPSAPLTLPGLGFQ